MRQVKMLRQGDTIGMIAPSGPASDRARIDQAIAAIEALGFRVIAGASCFEKWGYLAGSDVLRANDINTFFADPAIDGIFCMKGGDGAPRLLDRLDLPTIARHPKVFLGYSDITALHLVFNQHADFITFHGPMPLVDFIKPEFAGYNHDNLRRALMSPAPLGEIAPPDDAPPVETLSPGDAEGELVGGNLALICALMGTPFEIDTSGKILLIEDTDEANYRIDRMLTQLRLAGKLEAAAGIVIGQFTNTEPADPNKRLSLDEVFTSLLLPLHTPILKLLSFGHDVYKATLPLGARARIDGTNRRLVVIESGVCEE
ncbi:LD-carboxypeptidase [candidate division KSB3 bacterium]|uniref:LD-carboxypeptidase n=1 Tax=candidate division KSB3 bacterium TaxID=2044937 RepID=A0A9D5Q5E1_9BACT|nr:LD-carboxypeptidase [candidate division KSB3 bacterium]MBD3324734.1 LD-carboxypeptidase [candidate division KSB3 bacterium]